MPDFSKASENGSGDNLPAKPRYARGLSNVAGRWMDQDARESIEKWEAEHAPPKPYEPRCDTCNSPYRDFIETLLLKGTPYVHIAAKVPGPEGKPLDRRSISNHAKQHMGIADQAMIAVLQDEAERAGQNYEEGVKGMITHRGALEVALRKSYEDIINGVTTVEPRELVQIIQTLNKMDEQTNSVQVDEYKAQVGAFIQAIQKNVDRETWEKIAQDAKSIYAGAANVVVSPPPEIESPEPVDVEIVDAEPV